MSEAAQRKEKQKWATEKPKLDSARRLRGILFTSLIQRMRSLEKLFKKNARTKLEVLMPATMLCKITGGKYKETCHISDVRKTKYACIVEADESTRRRLEGILHKHHEDHIAGKGTNSLSHCNLVHNFTPMPKAL